MDIRDDHSLTRLLQKKLGLIDNVGEHGTGVIQKVAYSFRDPILHLFNGPLDFLHHTLEFGSSTDLVRERLSSDVFQRLGQTAVFAQTVTVETLHVRSAVSSPLRHPLLI